LRLFDFSKYEMCTYFGAEGVTFIILRAVSKCVDSGHICGSIHGLSAYTLCDDAEAVCCEAMIT